MNDSTQTSDTEPAGRKSWWQRLTGGLKRTSASIGTALSDLVSKRKLDAAAIEEIEDVLIRADLGVAAAGRIAEALSEGRYAEGISPDEIKAGLAAQGEKTPAPGAEPPVGEGRKPVLIPPGRVNRS